MAKCILSRVRLLTKIPHCSLCMLQIWVFQHFLFFALSSRPTGYQTLLPGRCCTELSRHYLDFPPAPKKQALIVPMWWRRTWAWWRKELRRQVWGETATCRPTAHHHLNSLLPLVPPWAAHKATAFSLPPPPPTAPSPALHRGLMPLYPATQSPPELQERDLVMATCWCAHSWAAQPCHHRHVPPGPITTAAAQGPQPCPDPASTAILWNYLLHR